MKPGMLPHPRLRVLAALLAICVAHGPIALGQPRFEAGIALGPSNFLGDLGGNFGRGTTFLKDNNIELTRIMKGVYMSFSPSPLLNFRAAVNFGRLEGADSIIQPLGGHELTRIERNLHFRSPLAEAYLAAEIYPTVFLEADKYDLTRKFRPFLLIGAGVFRFNPQGQYDDGNGNKTWVDLRPLRTEGQGMPQYPHRKEYSLTAMNIPYGFGFRYFFNERFNIGMEVVVRSTFTDYVDDVSTTYVPDQHFYDYFGANTFEAALAIQMANMSNLSIQSNTRSGFTGIELRGDPKDDDSYYSTALKFGVTIGRPQSGYMRNASDRLRCPVVRF